MIRLNNYDNDEYRKYQERQQWRDYLDQQAQNLRYREEAEAQRRNYDTEELQEQRQEEHQQMIKNARKKFGKFGKRLRRKSIFNAEDDEDEDVEETEEEESEEDEDFEDEDEEEEKPHKKQSWFQKLTDRVGEYLDGVGYDDDEDENQTRQWIYRAYYNANKRHTFIGDWLNSLNKGNLVSYLKGQKTVSTNNDLDKAVHKYKRKIKTLDRLAKLQIILNLIPILIPIVHPSLVFGAVGLLIWTVNTALMCLMISYSTFVTKLQSRERMVTRKGKKKVIAREDIVSNQRNQLLSMFNYASHFMTLGFMVAVNFFIYPLINLAGDVGTLTFQHIQIDGAVVHSFVGNGIFTHAILIVISYVMAYASYKDIENVMTTYQSYVDTALEEQRYRLLPLHELLNGKPAESQADIVVGQSLITGDNVMLNVADRANGVLVDGPNGAGKTGSIFKPFISQDLQKLVYWFRKFPEISRRPDYNSKKVAAKYLNGIVVMETTNDLCTEVYKLAHDDLGIPDEMIRWLDPGNNDSDTLNLMRGPADSVANTLVECIGSLSEGDSGSESGNYFAQAQKSWLQNYVLLVKYGSVFMDVPVSFDDLFNACLEIANTDKYRQFIEVYLEILRKARVLYYIYARKHTDLQVPRNTDIEQDIRDYEISGSPAFKDAIKRAKNTNDVTYHRNAAVIFKQFDQATIERTKRFISSEQFISNMINYEDNYDSARVNYNLALPFDEIQTAYQNVLNVKRWFDNNVLKLHDVPNVNKDGKEVKSADQMTIEKRQQNGATISRRGDWAYIDVQESSVKGIKNTLSSMAENKYVRRIFFNLKENDNFSINNFFHSGGLLLFYTGKSVDGMSTENSRMIAKIEQSIIFSAAQTRYLDDGGAAEPLIPVYFDEHIDYMDAEFAKVTGQIRKYNVPMTSIVQSYAQIDEKFGMPFRKTLTATMRTKISFGDVEPDDAKYLSGAFGTHLEFVEQRSTMQKEGPHNDSSMLRGSFQEVPNITPEQIARMQEYTLAIRTDEKNSPMPFDHIRVEQVNDEALKQSEMHVDVKNNPVDHEAFELYQKNISAMNPDFEGVDDIFHEYFMRTKAYFDNDQADIFKEGYDYDHKFEKVEVNAEEAVEYVRGMNNRADLPDYSQVDSESTYVTGVPDWVFEELRDNLFNVDPPKSSNKEDSDSSSNTHINEVQNEDAPEMAVNVNKNRPHKKGQRADAISEDEMMKSVLEAVDEDIVPIDDNDLAQAFDDDEAEVADFTDDEEPAMDADSGKGTLADIIDNHASEKEESSNAELPQLEENKNSEALVKTSKKEQESVAKVSPMDEEVKSKDAVKASLEEPTKGFEKAEKLDEDLEKNSKADADEKVEVVNEEDKDYKLPDDETHVETDDDRVNDLFD